MSIDFDALLIPANEIVSRASDAILSHTRAESSAGPVSTKSSIGDLVSQLDRRLEESISGQLRSLLPQAQVIGEEQGRSGMSSLGWVVDPIDGSTNVIHRLPHAAVCVALCIDFVPMMGVVRNPFTAETFYAIRGNGAYVSRDANLRSRTALRVSDIGSLKDALLSFGMPYDRSKAGLVLSVAGRTFQECQDLRRRGSASLDIVAVAAGQTEGHFEVDLRVWDVAAAGLILEEAGGVLANWSGGEISWESAGDKLDVVASNRATQEELLAIVSLPGP